MKFLLVTNKGLECFAERDKADSAFAVAANQEGYPPCILLIVTQEDQPIPPVRILSEQRLNEVLGVKYK